MYLYFPDMPRKNQCINLHICSNKWVQYPYLPNATESGGPYQRHWLSVNISLTEMAGQLSNVLWTGYILTSIL